MEHTQQLGKNAALLADKAKQMLGDDYQLSHSGTEQQFNSGTAEELAYNAIDHHVTYHKTQYSHNEHRDRYTEQAFRDHRNEQQDGQAPASASTYDYEKQGGGSAQNEPSPAQQTLRLPETSGTGLSGALGTGGGLPPPSEPYGPGKDGPLSGTARKYNGITMTAEAPELWKNTEKLSDNTEKKNKLDAKRKYVRQGYKRLSVNIAGKEHSVKGRLLFRFSPHPIYNGRTHYGKEYWNGKEKIDFVHTERLRYGIVIDQKKMSRKDYDDWRRKREKKSFRRRAAGRFAYRKGHALIDEESLQEDETIGSMKGYMRRGLRFAAMSTRQNIRTLKLQNNIYARFEQAGAKTQVLHNKRERLLKKSDRAMYKQNRRAAASREQKKKLKKMMVQRRAQEEGNFFRRTKHQFMAKKTTREYRRRVVKRTLSTVISICGLLLALAGFLVCLLLIVLSVSEGGAEYYASAVTQNDYTTITEATAYFRKLETDLDEYLNADRDALEAELDAEYGPDIYEFIYNLADFGFSANTLLAYLSAVYGEFTLEEVRAELDEIFKEMYTLIIEVKTEDREVEKYDPAADGYVTVTEAKKICYVTLEKKELEEVVESRLPEELDFQYGAYKLSTGGQQVYAPVMREDWTEKISSNYGERIHPITKVRTMHKGVDIAIPVGTKLYSAVTGVVTKSYYSDTGGHMVTVQTDTGWTVTFMHMDSRAVSAGQKIEQGDFVGESGNTGNSTGPHLHLQVTRPDGETINPIFIIPQTCAVRDNGTEE